PLHHAVQVAVVLPGVQADLQPGGLRPRLRRGRQAGHQATSVRAGAAAGATGGDPGAMSRPKTSPNTGTIAAATSSRGSGRPRRRCIEVTAAPRRPHGTIRPKRDRSVFTFRANPCVVTQRDRCTPRLAIFSGPTQTPVSPG